MSKKIELRISEKLKNTFKTKCAANGKGMTEVLIELITSYCHDSNTPKNRNVMTEKSIKKDIVMTNSKKKPKRVMTEAKNVATTETSKPLRFNTAKDGKESKKGKLQKVGNNWVWVES